MESCRYPYRKLPFYRSSSLDSSSAPRSFHPAAGDCADAAAVAPVHVSGLRGGAQRRHSFCPLFQYYPSVSALRFSLSPHFHTSTLTCPGAQPEPWTRGEGRRLGGAGDGRQPLAAGPALLAAVRQPLPQVSGAGINSYSSRGRQARGGWRGQSPSSLLHMQRSRTASCRSWSLRSESIAQAMVARGFRGPHLHTMYMTRWVDIEEAGGTSVHCSALDHRLEFRLFLHHFSCSSGSIGTRCLPTLRRLRCLSASWPHRSSTDGSNVLQNIFSCEIEGRLFDHISLWSQDEWRGYCKTWTILVIVAVCPALTAAAILSMVPKDWLHGGGA